MPLSTKLLSLAVLTALGGNAGAMDLGLVSGRALNHIRANAIETRTTANDAFVVRDAIVDANGTEHVRFDRTYHGLPVLGGDLVVHSKGTQFESASLMQRNPINLSIAPALTASAAITRARAQFGRALEAQPTARLVVYARGNAPRLAYETVLTGALADQTPTRMHYIVDAQTGAVLARWDTIHTGLVPIPGTSTPAIGSGRSLLSGTVPLNTVRNSRLIYELRDSTRGGTYTVDMGGLGARWAGTLVVDGDNTWGNGSRSDRATIAVDAQWGVAKTWDYYKSTFNRSGIANDGKGTYNRVHFAKNYVNAFFDTDCLCMSFGDGDGVTYNPLVMLDVTGHEVSHGMTFKTANLNYFGASGGLNEATSDIFGTMIEYYANNPSNPPNYLIGEKLLMKNPGTLLALRYMFKPSLDGISPDCYPANDPEYREFFDNWLDVHFSSGVANHFFYLLAEGAVPPAGFGLTRNDLVCNGNTAITGIGRAAAQQIWYRALTVYMTSTTNYAGARVATLRAAADLYGAGSVRHKAVAAAWSAVSVN